MVHLVTAVIRPEKLEPVLAALTEAGATGMTVTDVRGYGHEPIRTGTFCGSVYKTVFVPKVKVEIVVPDEKCSQVVETIQSSAKTGRIGDGKIFILPCEEVIRIRTGERGTAAI